MNKHFVENEVEEPKNKADPAESNWKTNQQKTEAISTCYDWFEKDRMAKQSYIGEMDEMYKLFKSAHWDLLDDNGQVLRTAGQKLNHPNAVENITFAMVEGLVAEFSDTKELVDYPQEEGDEEAALVMTELKEFIAYKNRFDGELIKFLRWFFLYGTGIWETFWDPTWKGGKGPNRWSGEVRIQALHPRCVFPDARCLNSFEDGRRIHKAIYWTKEEVEEVWPEAEGITPDSVSDDLLVSDELEDTSAEATEDVILVVDTWYKGSPMITEEGEEDQGPGLHLIQWAGEGSLKYLSHENYVNFDPGEDIVFPIRGYKCYERERSPWGMGEAFQLKNPQIIANKTAELIIEGHIYEAMGQTWYESNAVTEKQKKNIQTKGTLGGMWFEVEDVNGIHREYGRNVPSTLENESNRLQKVMETIVGRYDISQGKTPGSITAFRALDLLNSRAQVRLKSKEMTINLSLEDNGNYQNRLISRNYNEKRKYRILGKDDAKPAWGTYDNESMKKVYLFDWDESMSMTDFGQLTAGQEYLPPEQQMIEGQDYEVYSPEFDTLCKITSRMPSDRTFYMEMAKELYAGQLIDIETFYYVIEYGKFPPFEKILDKIKAQQQPQPGIPGGQDPNQQLEAFIQMLQESHPEILQKLAKLPKEQQVPVLLDLMKKLGPTLEANGGQPPALPPGQQSNPELPEQLDPDALKQQLIDIVLAQKEQYSNQA